MAQTETYSTQVWISTLIRTLMRS